MKIIITTYPFTKTNKQLLELEKIGATIRFNPYKRKMNHKEHYDFLVSEQPDIIIAGTEEYTESVLNICKNLKLISRVGIGTDSIDKCVCKKMKIKVTNTPDAPTNAVAEFVIGQIITLLRKINIVDYDIRNKNWNRYIGREIKNCNIGIIGYGRIGSSIFEKLKAFNPKKIYINDIIKNKVDEKLIPIENDKIFFSSKEGILKECDIISIHIPLNKKNKNFISKKDLEMMKKNSIIINSSRGGIINEDDLYNWLKKNKEACAAVDTFETEPYVGKFVELENILLTPHLGSCSKQSRYDMEKNSINNVITFLKK